MELSSPLSRQISKLIMIAVLILILVSCQTKPSNNSDGIVLDTVALPKAKSDPTSLEKLDKRTITNFDSIHLNGNTYYVIEGDILITTADLKRKLKNDSLLSVKLKDTSQYEHKWLAYPKTIIRIDQTSNDTIKWKKFPIKYCINKKSFASIPGGYEKVKSAVAMACGNWATLCGVQFRYDETLDNNATVMLGKDVDFIITYKPVTGLSYVATSFFPEDSADKHILLVYPAYWTTAYDHIGVFRHEIGHILGFRHEETTFSANIPTFCRQTPFPDEATLGIDYDKLSVMHYFCGGNGTRQLKFSDNDKKTFPIIYPQ